MKEMRLVLGLIQHLKNGFHTFDFQPFNRRRVTLELLKGQEEVSMKTIMQLEEVPMEELEWLVTIISDD